VDGVGVRLRRFRKSHHFVPASLGPDTLDHRRVQPPRREMGAHAGGPRAYRSYPNFEKRQGRDGMSLLEGVIDSRNNPLAVVEDVAADNNLSFERSGEDEITIVAKGNWTDYQLSFTWMNEIEALHLACAFDMKIPEPRSTSNYGSGISTSGPTPA
jgi:hypothetical protein